MRSQQDTAGRLLGIDEINWRSLPAVYGDAGDTPKLIRRLYKAQKFQKAADELDYSLFHQGFITRAAIVAVPFFAEVAADQSAPGRHEALGLLVGYAESISMKGCRPADLGHPKMDRQAHAALTACVPVLRPGLDDDDPQVRCDTAEILSLVERLPDDVTRALRARLVAETDDTVLGALVGALLVHGGLDEDEVARLRGCSALARFAIAWDAVAAGGTDPTDLQTLVELWNTCLPDCADSGIARGGIEALVRPCPESVAWLAGLVRQGGMAAYHGLAGLSTFLYSRRDLYPAVLDALLHLAAHPGQGFDDDSFWTPRHTLVLTMAAAVPAAGDRRTELLDALALLVDGAPSPERLSDDFSAQDDLRADALPALLGRPGSMDLLRAVLADCDDMVMVNKSADLGSSEGPLPGELVACVGR